MKKLAAILLVMTLAVFTACSAGGASSTTPTAVPTIEPTAAATPAPTAEPTPTPMPENMNLLTGEFTLTPEAVGKRPVAVMVNNSSDNLPQYGISQADLVFEIPVEGDITRLMCMYGDYTQVPDICSIRSCRYYFPTLSEGFDAMYVHWGMDPTIAMQTLDELGVDHIDGNYYDFDLFGRDDDKYSQGYNVEHCSVFYGTGMAKALAANDYRTDLKEEKKVPAFQFSAAEKAAAGTDSTTLGIQFGGGYYSDFTYDTASKTYLKDHNGSAHMDARTGEQLAFKNLLVLETEVGMLPNDEVGLRQIDVTSGGSGYYYAGGKVEPITWAKGSATEQLRITDAAGAPLSINTGKTYVAFCNPDSIVSGEAE